MQWPFESTKDPSHRPSPNTTGSPMHYPPPHPPIPAMLFALVSHVVAAQILLEAFLLPYLVWFFLTKACPRAMSTP